ncbi:hypothetical protein CROQUDRAFT_656391 [Cronartium quercuum f. sp. fusiforme G11]|uniref:BZIP domain-containing protein n=1 Tax=Cronartium quercuum f. sp. fusiforme G11 TaxID=708437 RepID=A0A9P6NJS3_9BASI|nr:hypothetical protein CROQUDRAFT_656391 [Cronartium quercuum f. sp. fusiforme G11]
MQSHLIHPSQSYPHPHSHSPSVSAHPPLKRTKVEDDEEILAKKKKNADAQAAFRLRRQTYIKSLEDTVTELKNAVSEMESLVKTANHDVKLQRERAAYLDAKLKQANLNVLTSTDQTSEAQPGSGSHCSCCRFASALDHTPQLSLIPDTSGAPTSLINPTTPTVPTPASTPVHTPQASQNAHQHTDWQNQQRSYASLLVSHHSSQSQPPQPRPHSPQSAYNRLLHPASTNEHRTDSAGGSSYGTIFLDAFTQSTPTTSAFYHPTLDISHHHHHSSSPAALELDTSLLTSPPTPRLTGYAGLHQPTPRAWHGFANEHFKLDEGAAQFYGSMEDQSQAQGKRRRDEEIGTIKLNGLPAKVARCNQAVLEVSKVVEQAKLATAAGGVRSAKPMKLEQKNFGGAGLV